MKDMSEIISGPAGQKNLFNSGAPMSRTLNQVIESSIFDVKDLKAAHEIHFAEIPAHVTDIEEWVRSLYSPGVFSEWDEIKYELALPGLSLLVVPAGSVPVYTKVSKHVMLRSAVILSKCSACRYDPFSPMIFTRHRLERKIELIKINLQNYYELD